MSRADDLGAALVARLMTALLAGLGTALIVIQSGWLGWARALVADRGSVTLEELLIVILLPAIALAATSVRALHHTRRAAIARERDLVRASDLANRDPLTGLLNRRGLEAAIDARTGSPLSLFLIDIDGFKAINDRWGHARGDRVLERLADHLRDLEQQHGAVAARLGGDEMALIAPCDAAAQRAISTSLGRPIVVDEEAELVFAVSVGEVSVEDGAFASALERADVSMYEAKRARKSGRGDTLDSDRVFERQFAASDAPGAEYSLIAIGVARADGGGSGLAYGRRGPLLQAVRAQVAAILPELQIERLAPDVLGIAVPASQLAAATDRLRSLDILVSIDGVDHRMTLSLGRAGPGVRLKIRDLIDQALLALQEARRSETEIVDFDATRRALMRSNALLLRDLRKATTDGSLELHYQPKLNIRTGSFSSAEALVRWTHPQLGKISPAEFIPLAEDSGDIRALTQWVFEAACRGSCRFQQAGLDQLIYVNVSALLIADDGFVATLIDTALASEARLGIEVTETACLQQPQRALGNLQRLVDAGFRIAIDDYGVGLSSLTYLRQMPASELKIDMSFIRDLADSQRDPLIVRSTIDLAHALDLQVTAEGVDKPEILALLKIMGCDVIQGFEVATPMPLDECISFLQRGYVATSELPDYAADLRRFALPALASV